MFNISRSRTLRYLCHFRLAGRDEGMHERAALVRVLESNLWPAKEKPSAVKAIRKRMEAERT